MTKSKEELLEEVSKEIGNIEIQGYLHKVSGRDAYGDSALKSKGRILDLFSKVCDEINRLEEEKEWLRRNMVDLKAAEVVLRKDNKRFRETLEEVIELSKHDGHSRYLDKCYVVAGIALGVTE